jgi:tetratricopeptide (TPR) repeat protein
MAYWGEALAAGPNINDPATQPDRERQAYDAVQKARAHKANASAVEQAFIDALAQRFPDSSGANRELRMAAYAEAMGKVYERFPDDADVGTLYAAAVMDTMPWDYYLKDGRPKPDITRAVATLEKMMARYPEHPGAHHYYIHAVEASPDPDRGVPAADKLGKLVPGAGHLVHMPAHIYIRVGRYADASEANVKAIAADQDYITQCRVQGIYPAAYYPHNIHFLTAALAMEGRSADMFEAAGKVSHHHDEPALKEPGFAFPHLMRAIPDLAMVRFGKWEEILKLEEPHGSPFDKGMWHFARGMAYTRRNQVSDAQRELAELRKIAALPELKELKIFDLNSLAPLAEIGVEVLSGEIAAQQRNYDRAVAHLRKAISIDDNLLYAEPPDWPNPIRHNLGAVLLEAGRATEAEKVYREDLRRHRDNGWALYGLAQSLEKQGKQKEASEVMERFKRAWTRADINLTASRL